MAWRLRRCGFPVVILEQPRPTVIRRMVAFATAVYEGSITVEGVMARRAEPHEVPGLLAEEVIPVLVDPDGNALPRLRPAVLVDAILAKRATGTRITDAGLVVALGPGFCAGKDCHAVVETSRGHTLGRVYWHGEALPNTGVPGELGGAGEKRVVRAPAAGVLRPLAQIGDTVRAGQVVAQVGEEAVTAGIGGVLRGLLHGGLSVTPGMKVGDVDPRGERDYCFTISDKALTIAGGVLEAVVSWMHGRAGKHGGSDGCADGGQDPDR